MAYIALQNEHLPGIAGLLDSFRDTAVPLSMLAETLLQQESTLTKGERELIAASVSWWNGCMFCHNSHGAAAAAHLGADLDLILDIRNGLPNTTLSPKFRALLEIAKCVQQSGTEVTEESIATARNEGATDREIHDVVLIAAAFCMYNRYVDGLGTYAPEDLEAYGPMGKRLAEHGYMRKE